jgi:8-oxo-dGTP pyrophosphatase MutT (NUDIX family)
MIYIKNFEYFGDGANAVYSNDAGDVFWGNVGAGCLPISRKTKKILLCYRSSYVNEPHTWSGFGGKVEEDDSLNDTVINELCEETGYYGDIDLIPVFIFRNKNKTFEYHNYIGIVDNEFEPILNWESDGYKWVTFEQLLKIEDKHPGLELLLKDKKTLDVINHILF